MRRGSKSVHGGHLLSVVVAGLTNPTGGRELLLLDVLLSEGVLAGRRGLSTELVKREDFRTAYQPRCIELCAPVLVLDAAVGALPIEERLERDSRRRYFHLELLARGRRVP